MIRKRILDILNTSGCSALTRALNVAFYLQTETEVSPDIVVLANIIAAASDWPATAALEICTYLYDAFEAFQGNDWFDDDPETQVAIAKPDRVYYTAATTAI